MTQAWSALALALATSCLWTRLLAQNVCQEMEPLQRGDLDEKAWVVRQVCCAGYEGLPGHCQPRCTPGCVNAQCTAPQECTCNAGYETVGGSDNSTVGCQPKCQDCRYGDCIAPNTCRCWPAFQGRSLGQGCQPMAEFLMPAERCLLNACNCWQEYYSWTPWLQVAPECVSICQSGGRPQSCLNLAQCVCNRLTQYLVCEGEELERPQQYACEVGMARADPESSGKTHSDWTAKTAQTDSTDPTKYITDGSEWVFLMDTLRPKDRQNKLDPNVDGMLPNLALNRESRTTITDLINAWKARPGKDYSNIVYSTDKIYSLDHIDNSDHRDNSDHIVSAEHKDHSQHTDNSDRSIHIQLQANQMPQQTHANERIFEKITVNKVLKKSRSFKKLHLIILCGILVVVIIILGGVVLCFAFYA